MLVVSSTIALALLMLQSAPSPSKPPTAAQTRQTHGDARKITLVLPHALHKGETAWLLVKVGAIDHHQIRLTTGDGLLLGTISPFGARAGHAAGTYTVPVPDEAFSKGRLALRLAVMQSGGAQRAPTAEEIRGVHLVIRRFRK
jgi:hypothetical protein